MFDERNDTKLFLYFLIRMKNEGKKVTNVQSLENWLKMGSKKYYYFKMDQ